MNIFFSIHHIGDRGAMTPELPADRLIEIFLVLDGPVILEEKGDCLSLGSKDLYCSDGSGTRRILMKGKVEGYVIRFNRAFLYRSDETFYCSWLPAFQSLVLTRRAIRMEEAFSKEAKRICEMMHREFRHEHDFKLQMLCASLNILLFHLMRQLDEGLSRIGYNTGRIVGFSLVYRFIMLLEQHFKTNKKVSDYAALLYISTNHLNGTIKQATGKSVGALIRQRVIWEAVRQARNTGASMKEVAYDLGFNDMGHFSKFFKKEAGESFTEVRRHLPS
jgi:AraC-like DNA-binding protein